MKIEIIACAEQEFGEAIVVCEFALTYQICYGIKYIKQENIVCMLYQRDHLAKQQRSIPMIEKQLLILTIRSEKVCLKLLMN